MKAFRLLTFFRKTFDSVFQLNWMIALLSGAMIFLIGYLSTHQCQNEIFTLLLALSFYFFVVIVALVRFRGKIEFQGKCQELEMNRLWLNALLESSTDGVHILDLDGNLIEWSPSFIEMIGYSDQEARDLNITDWDDMYSEGEKNTIRETLLITGRIGFETRHRRKDGTILDVEITARSILLEGNHYIYASARDITHRKRVENELSKLSQAIEQSPVSVIITGLDGKIEYVNSTFEHSTGYTKEEVLGKSPRFLQSGNTPKKTYKEMWAYITHGKTWHGELINKRKDGSEYIELARISPIFKSDGTITHYMAIKEDITEKKQAEQHLQYLANFDSLTGLPNRRQLENRIDYALKLAKRDNRAVAVMFLDLDHFKNINDTMGHKSGDTLLIEVAKRLKSVIREEDTVARLGGDEFVFLLPDSNNKGIVHFVKKLFGVLSQPFLIEENELMISASIGVALYPADGSDHQTLLKNADAAMYRAKQDGRNSYCFFAQVMQDQTSRNLLLTNALHHALDRQQLRVVYQPQVSAFDGSVVGAEALLRWKHPEYGEISPAEFIPLAEDNGLILRIGEWVLRTAVAQAKEWIQSGLQPISIAVNLSTVQFRHPDLLNMITNVLDEIALPREYLEIELTEAVAMHNPNLVCDIMQQLYEHGIRISIDDFGTGYSSLSYLKKFKVYKLKIDRSFIRNIDTDSEDKAIVKAIISMAHSLSLKTIAEGVETVEQLDFLRQEGCDEIQGYYYSKPLERDEFDRYARSKANL